jgi:hypothetical protein
MAECPRVGMGMEGRSLFSKLIACFVSNLRSGLPTKHITFGFANACPCPPIEHTLRVFGSLGYKPCVPRRCGDGCEIIGLPSLSIIFGLGANGPWPPSPLQARRSRWCPWSPTRTRARQRSASWSSPSRCRRHWGDTVIAWVEPPGRLLRAR